MWCVDSSDGRRTPCLPPPTAATPSRVSLGSFSWDVTLFQHSRLHAIFYFITCCALPTGTSKAPALTVKPLCDLICLISFECGDNGCCLSPISCHLFFWTHHLPGISSGNLSKHSPVTGLGFGQPVTPWGLSLNQSLHPCWSHFPEEAFPASHDQDLSSTHSASSCQMHLAQQLSAAPYCLSN